MPKKKDEEMEVLIKDETMEEVETEVVKSKEKSEEYNKFLKMMQAYKQQNPVKYKQKEEAFLKKLETL